MDIETVSKLILAIAGLIGLFTYAGYWLLRFVTKSNAKLEAELRADIAEKSSSWQKTKADLANAQRDLAAAQRDIVKLQSSAAEKDAEIEQLKLQVETLTRAIDTMYENYAKEKTARKDGEEENGRLRQLLTEKERMCQELFENNQQYAHEIEILRGLIIGKIARANELEEIESRETK